jgi:hypothetical protein
VLVTVGALASLLLSDMLAIKLMACSIHCACNLSQGCECELLARTIVSRNGPGYFYGLIITSEHDFGQLGIGRHLSSNVC